MLVHPDLDIAGSRLTELGKRISWLMAISFSQLAVNVERQLLCFLRHLTRTADQPPLVEGEANLDTE